MNAALGQLKAEINERIDGLSTEIKEFQTEIRAEIKELLVTLDERFDRKLERMESRLAGGFWNWARPKEIRQRADHAQLIGLDERVTLIESRLTDFESRQQPGA